jgi:hypothetical protein
MSKSYNSSSPWRLHGGSVTAVLGVIKSRLESWFYFRHRVKGQNLFQVSDQLDEGANRLGFCPLVTL